MSHLRSLRLSRALTFFDLAALSGIPARAIAEAEFGLRDLSHADSAQLAMVFGVADQSLSGGHGPHSRATVWRSGGLSPTTHHLPARSAPELATDFRNALVALALAGTIATATSQAVPISSLHLPSLRLPSISLPNISLALSDAPQAAAPTTEPAPSAALRAGAALGSAVNVLSQGGEQPFAQAALRASLGQPVRAPIGPALLVAPIPAPQPIPLPAPSPAPAPRFTMSERGPLGCPVQPAQGRVVLTQGYGVGSHAPAAVWGAVDLAVDGDGDGWAEPGASWYTPVVATHDGVITVTMESYPAGNHVWVRASDSPWRTGYAHLAIVSVISGQYVRAGEQIGLIGSSGASSGPHLDYQVWNGERNIDPTELVLACQNE